MHVFITGGTRGIGQGLVNEFIKRGHVVSFTGTTQKSVDKSIEKLSGEYIGLVCDVRNSTELVTAKDKAINKFGKIDIWINNAGVSHLQKDISDLSEDEIKRVIDINVTGMIMGTNIALNEMKKQGYGSIYNFEGLGSDGRVIPKTIVYGASKRLVRYFSRACNKELKEYPNIFVGTISPGMVFTDLLLKDATKDSMKIMGILGNDVETVTPFIVKKVLKRKQYIYWLTTRKVMFKFFMSVFKHEKKNSNWFCLIRINRLGGMKWN